MVYVIINKRSFESFMCWDFLCVSYFVSDEDTLSERLYDPSSFRQWAFLVCPASTSVRKKYGTTLTVIVLSIYKA